MALTKNKILKNPDKYSVDELVQAIRERVVSMNDLQATGLLSVSKRYAIKAKVDGQLGQSSDYQNGGEQQQTTPKNNNGSSYGAYGDDSDYTFRGNQRPRRSTRSNADFRTLFIVVGILLGIIAIGGGVWYGINRFSSMKPENIYSKYKNSVVMIVRQYHYEASIDGTDLSKVIDGLGGDSTGFSKIMWDNADIKLGSSAIVSGTGFFISKDGRIMTNKHVVTDIMAYADTIRDDLRKKFKSISYYPFFPYATCQYIADNIEVRYVEEFIRIARNDTHLNGVDELIPCTLIKKSNDEDLDIAILQLNNKKTPDDVTNVIDVNGFADVDKNLKLGTDLYSIGFPLSLSVGQTNIGIEATNQHGTITQECGDYTYGHDINIHHGASGSPIFDNHGRFAGVVNAGLIINGASMGYNKAIKPNKAASMFN